MALVIVGRKRFFMVCWIRSKYGLYSNIVMARNEAQRYIDIYHNASICFLLDATFWCLIRKGWGSVTVVDLCSMWILYKPAFSGSRHFGRCSGGVWSLLINSFYMFIYLFEWFWLTRSSENAFWLYHRTILIALLLLSSNLPDATYALWSMKKEMKCGYCLAIMNFIKLVLTSGSRRFTGLE